MRRLPYCHVEEKAAILPCRGEGCHTVEEKAAILHSSCRDNTPLYLKLPAFFAIEIKARKGGGHQRALLHSPCPEVTLQAKPPVLCAAGTRLRDHLAIKTACFVHSRDQTQRSPCNQNRLFCAQRRPDLEITLQSKPPDLCAAETRPRDLLTIKTACFVRSGDQT